MAQVNALAPSGITSQLVIEPGHWYWNNRELTADRFLYSFVNRKEPTCFGGSSTTNAPGGTTIATGNIYNPSNQVNSAYQANFYQTPTAPISVALFNVAGWVSISGMVVGEYLEFSFTNSGTGSNSVTVTASAGGWTEVGSMVIAAQTTARFRMYVSVIDSGLEAGSLIRIN